MLWLIALGQGCLVLLSLSGEERSQEKIENVDFWFGFVSNVRPEQKRIKMFPFHSSLPLHRSIPTSSRRVPIFNYLHGLTSPIRKGQTVAAGIVGNLGVSFWIRRRLSCWQPKGPAQQDFPKPSSAVHHTLLLLPSGHHKRIGSFIHSGQNTRMI